MPSDAFLAAMFRALVGQTGDYFSCIDRDRRILYLSRTLTRELPSVLGHRSEEFVALGYRQQAIECIESAFASDEPQRMEIDVSLADGGTHCFEIRVVPFRGPEGQQLALQVTTDLSEQRRLSAELSRSEEFRKLIVENLPDYVVMLDRGRYFRWLNRVAPGLRPEQVMNQHLDQFVGAPYRDRIRAVIESVFETGQAGHYEVEAYGDGVQQAWYSTRVVPLGSRVPPEHVLLITSDATVRKRAELALRASEERFRSLAERSPDVIAILDRNHIIEYLNRAPHGCLLEDTIGACFDDFARPEELETIRGAIESVFTSGQATEFDAGVPNSELVFRVRVSPFDWVEGAQHALAVSTDVTRLRLDEQARQSLQAQLHQAQRRESVGMLAGGIAHDFNNLLQVIQTNLHFARELLRPTGLALDELGEALRATERAAELTTHLLAVGRRQRVNPKNIDLSVLIGESLRMLRRVLPESIELTFEGSVDPCWVSADPPQLEQVLLNLCLNARDAMPSGGQLFVSVQCVEGPPKLARLCVRDSGSGISEENLKQVFEPFFSTKGAGSGLGLAVAAGIVAAHGGTISVASRIGEGATFTVDLPRGEAPAKEVDQPKRGPERGDELLLVAEDEPLVRAQAVRILKRAGYSVLEAEDGVKAVELFSAQPDAIKLVLLDVIMPGLDGWQVFSKLSALRPNVKVLFITGYAASALPPDFGTRGKRLLSKPYKPQVLLELVRELLDHE